MLGRGNGRSIGPSRGGDSGTSGEAVVTETGIALVHEGERIRPRPEDVAEIELAATDVRETITVNLPVIVQVHGRHDSAETDRIVSETIRRLRVAIESEGSLG